MPPFQPVSPPHTDRSPRRPASIDRWEDEGGSPHPEPIAIKRSAPVRRLATRRRETAQECRERAAADLLRSVSMLTANGRRQMESSAASWAARAAVLERADAGFEARKDAVAQLRCKPA